jgi:hypothetical protein
LGHFIRCQSSASKFVKKWVGLHIGRLFSRTHPVTLTAAAPATAAAAAAAAGTHKKFILEDSQIVPLRPTRANVCLCASLPAAAMPLLCFAFAADSRRRRAL